MNRYLGYGSLLLLIGWLVLSYGAWLPDRLYITAPLTQVGDWFQQATIIILLLFISIQLWLLRSTFRMVYRQQINAQSVPTPFSLNLFGELFWTVLPLLLTVGLAVAGYKLWTSIS